MSHAQQGGANYQSVPNPSNDSYSRNMSGHPQGFPAPGRRSTGDASGSASGSAESGRSSNSPMISNNQSGNGSGGAYVGSQRDVTSNGEYGPYSHLRKGSMGKMGSRPGLGGRGGYTAAGAGAGATLGANLNQHDAGNRASNYSAASSYGGDNKKYYQPQQDGLLWDSKGEAEPDDYLHNPDSKRGDSLHPCSARGILNVLALVVIVTGLLALFAGYPIIAHYTKRPDNTSGFNIGGTNGTGQVPDVSSRYLLVDNDTAPADRSWTNADGIKHHCVFSDEFNTPGRTFWPGDDPFWTAVDIWYGATGDYEWYAPEQVNTTDGYLQLTMEDRPTHNLNFRSGMLQSWNKFCFTGGYIEFAAILPGSPNTQGWWPGLWTMGNLGRPGYLGTTDGTWPYSYQGCDNGIRPNQSDIANGTPDSVVTSVKYGKTGLNWLPGMRLPSCTCSGEDHPGPSNNVGRSSPEIDALEAQTAQGVGEASQSLQTAPFDLAYDWDQDVAVLHPDGGTKLNTYTGGVYQEAVSGLSPIPNKAYELANNPTFTTFGFEYVPDDNNDGSGYITWYIDGKRTWTVTGASTPPRPNIGIGRRPIPTEPMSIIMNLGISEGFQHIEFDTLQFPATLKVDYVRVYQRDGQDDRKTCDPADHPTADYIKRHLDVYDNPNVTQWRDRHPWPKNRLIDGC